MVFQCLFVYAISLYLRDKMMRKTNKLKIPFLGNVNVYKNMFLNNLTKCLANKAFQYLMPLH